MNSGKSKPETLDRARSLRTTQTLSERLVWSLLRANQLCGLKFRRQYRIDPWIVDFACEPQKLVVEIDGGYHDEIVEDDLRRQSDLQRRGWKVLRFRNQDVEMNAESVACAIADELNLVFQFHPRKKSGSGMNCDQ
jgi:very-short-patch-repair endonuclease